MLTNPANLRSDAQALDFLSGGGEMSERIRAFDWSKTPLGSLETWPQSLKTALKIALNSRYPIWMGWGRELVNLYNTPYIPVLGKRDEWALGASARDVWKEVWEEHLGLQADAVLLRGEASWNDQRQMVMYRNGYAEETYFTFSFSPLPADEGGIGGLFCACTEDTQKVLGERRLAALRHLAAATADARTEAEAGAIAARTLAQHDADVSFALIYLNSLDGATARLAPGSRNLHDVRWAPPEISLIGHGDAGDTDIWPLRQAMDEGMQVLQNIDPKLGLPGGRWPEATATAAVVPLAKAGHAVARGFLVVGASPRLPFDENYRSFFELLARGTADALSNARAYEEERMRAEALAELDRAKTQFFSNVSHEFRTPLTLMLGPVEDLLARSHSELSPSAKDQLEVVNRNGLRLLRLVNTLLDFSRIEAGRVQACYEATDLGTFTAELASCFRAATDRAGLRLSVDCPPSSEPVYVDRDMWEKIVLNLLSNAFKFTFEGVIEVSLKEHAEKDVVRAGDDGDASALAEPHALRTARHVIFTVRDTGVGIPAQEMPRLFERFHRVQKMRSRTHEGSGIGLALVQELAKLHGGFVRADSALGKGSTFIVAIPLGTAHLPAEKIGGGRNQNSTALGATPFVEEALRWLPSEDNCECSVPVAELKNEQSIGSKDSAFSTPNSELSHTRPRVLVVDDNVDMRQYLARLLAERYGVETASDGEEALALIKLHRPDLILSDVMMPKLDGFGLLKALREDPQLKTIPVVLLSARAGEESRVEGLEHGADDYLIKPFSAKELFARVAAHLEMARVRREAEAALRDSEARYRNLISMMPAAMYTCDREGRITLYNDRAADLWGRKPTIGDEDQKFCGALKLFLPDGSPMPHSCNPMADSIRMGTGYRNQEVIIERPDGSRRHVLVNIDPLKGEDGAILGAINIFTDITERKRAEEALQRHAHRHELLSHTASRLLESEDPQELVEELCRKTMEFIDCHAFFNFLVDEPAGRLKLNACAGIPKEEVSQIEWLDYGVAVCGCVARDGQRIVAEDIQQSNDLLTELVRSYGIEAYCCHPLMIQGRVIGTLSFGTRSKPNFTSDDVEVMKAITDLVAVAMHRIHTEQSLRESQALLAAVLSQVPLGIGVMDTEGRWTLTNPIMDKLVPRAIPSTLPDRIERWYAWDKDGRSIPPEYWPGQRALRGEVVPGQEMLFIGDTGRERWMLVSAGPLHAGDGRLIGGICTIQDIDMLRRAQDAVRRSEEQLALVSNTVPALISYVDTDCRYRMCNRAYTDWFGLPCEEIVGRRMKDVLGEEAWLAIEPQVHSALAGETVDFETHARYLRGGTRWVRCIYTPHRDENGRVQGVVVLVSDVTERKRAEQAIRNQAEQFETVLNRAPLGVYLVDADFRIAQVNPIARPVFGDIPDLIGRDFDEVIHLLWEKRYADEIVGIFRHTFETGESYLTPERAEFRIDRGVTEYYEWRLDRITLPDGRYGLVCYFRDISAQVQAREQIRESEARFRTMADVSPVIIWVTDAAGGVKFINQAYRDFCGVSDEDIREHRWQMVVHPDDREQYVGEFARCVRDQTSFYARCRIKRVDGVWRWIASYGAPRFSGKGQFLGHVGSSPDIHDMQEAQERLNSWNVELEQAVNEKTAELQQSQERLRAMASELNLAEQRERKRLATELHDHLQQMLVFGKLTIGQSKRHVEDIPVAAEALKNVDTVLSDALSYSRTLVAELSPPVLRDHGLAAALNWLAEYMEQKHGQRVTVIVPEGEGLKLPEDQRILLFQSVRELLINAAKHAGTGAATVTMTEKEDEVQIQVRDEGRGFDLAAAAAAAAAAAGIPSGGISSKFGLFSIQERMRALGGSFDIQSVPGGGTTATLVLPVEKQSEKKRRAPESERMERAALAPDQSGATRIRVLLVDDHIMVRQGLRAVLDAYNEIQLVGEAGDGEEAVRLVEQWRPDVVVMDISMPKMSGIEATELIKKRYPETLIVGLSVNAAGENQEAMERAGAARLMTKEAAVEQLYDVIQDAVRQTGRLTSDVLLCRGPLVERPLRP